MPDWGALRIPKKLLTEGVADMVRISDAGMSGTAFVTVVLHVSPEPAAGGPLAIVADGDPVVLDVAGGSIHLDVPAAEIERRPTSSARPRTGAAMGRSTTRRPPGARGLRLRLPA